MNKTTEALKLAKEVGGVADDQTIVLFHEELEAVARAIRAEALEEAAKWFEDEEHPLQPKKVAAVIRGLK